MSQDTLTLREAGFAGSAAFMGGMNTAIDPLFLDDREYVRAMNVDLVGGSLATRPGFLDKLVLPAGRIQGAEFFRPRGGALYLVVVISGRVYASPAPFEGYFEIDFGVPVPFRDRARHAYLEPAVQSAVLNSDGTISLTDPKPVLIIQDGGYSRAGWWDGNTAAKSDPGNNGIPPGGPMKWLNGRLWVGDHEGNVFAGDISNPLAFSENSYLAEGQPFNVGGPVIAMEEVPSSLNSPLAVFTDATTTVFRADITVRDSWKSTSNFQARIFDNVGCVGPKAVVSQFGMLWWWSQAGLVSFDAAAAAMTSSKLPLRDVPINYHKTLISEPVKDKIALAVHDNHLLVAIPAQDMRNSQILVLDQYTPAGTPSWVSVWTGIFPEIFASTVGPGTRTFAVSKDADANRVWELYRRERKDAAGKVTAWVETKSHNAFSSKASGLTPKQIEYAELFFTGVEGELDVSVYWRGTRGSYKLLSTHRFLASDDEVSSITNTVGAVDLEPQTRRFRTQSVFATELPGSVCGVESSDFDNVDEAFQLLIVWSGVGHLRWYRIFARDSEEPSVGAQAETETTATAAPAGVKP